MRLWHAAGIRPVLTCSNASLPRQPQVLARLGGLALLHKSSSLKAKYEAKDKSEANGSEPKSAHHAIQPILDSIKREPQDQKTTFDSPASLINNDSSDHVDSPQSTSSPSHAEAEGPSDQENPVRFVVRSVHSVKRIPATRHERARQRHIKPIPKPISKPVSKRLRLDNHGRKSQTVKDAAQAPKHVENDQALQGAEEGVQTLGDSEKGNQDNALNTNATTSEAEKAVSEDFNDPAASITAAGPAARRKRRLIRKRASKAAVNTRLSHPTEPSQPATGESKGKNVKNALKASALHFSGQDSVQGISLAQALKGKVLEKAISSEPVHKRMSQDIETLNAEDVEMTALPIEQPPVPRLHHGLDRVLFNQGVYKLQDPYSMVYNFNPYLQEIMPVTEFDYNALAEYKTSSQDELLSSMAKEHSIRYVGSTSSMTSALGHFHYLLSNWRPINLEMLSKEFPEKSTTFTEINRAPNSIFLRWKNGTYAIDADKQYDGANVLMLLGKSLEKLLTMSPSDFERYRKSDPRNISSAERDAPESFHFSTQGDFLMRSQLDAHDPRLPGTGMFDLKTRAVVSVRMQSDDYEEMSGYELHQQHGRFESYEREYYDMIRSTMLKYSLQARMGRMDGIFVAYHNVKRIFGFQYLNLNEMDKALHGQSDRCLGNQEFSLSIDMLNKILNKATERYPNQSIRFHFETRPAILPFMYIFAEPVSEDEIDKIQNSQKEKIKEYERAVMGLDARSIEPSSEQVDISSEQHNTADEKSRPEATQIESGTLEVTDARSPEPGAGASSEESTSPTTETHTSSTTTGHNSSDSSADTNIQSPVTPEPKTIEENPRPLLAMTLTVRSRVNGHYVERPENLAPEDEWKIEYSLAEIPLPSRAWSLYEATKARRKKTFDRISSNDDDKSADEERKSARRGDGYIEMLKELSRKGRELRNNIEEATLDREKVIVGEPYGKLDNTTTAKRGDVEIHGVDDYLGWLFGPGRKD